MIILENELLSKHTTFKMGGSAQRFYIPQSIDELKVLVQKKPDISRYILSGGSNILVNDERVFDEVLSMREVDKTMEYRENGEFYIGASVRIQNAIKFINSYGYGGIEYLYSLPALMGGIVYMNAGRGRCYNKRISDYITRVRVLENGKECEYNKANCQFRDRDSIFQTKKNCIILGVFLKLEVMSESESKNLIKERIDLVKNKQDMSAPNFGSVFCEFNPKIMKVVKILGIGKKNGCHFSKNTMNWLLHGSEGTFREACQLIERIKIIHKILNKKCKVEVKIWE